MEINQGIADKLYNKIFPSLKKDDRIDIFLIGKSSSDASSIRYSIRKELETSSVYWNRRNTIHYPEELFSELLYDNKIDLLTLENILAESVSIIIICLESPGAIAELGAFVNHSQLRERILVVADEKRKKDKSFIRMGPIRLLENEIGKQSIIWHAYQDGDLKRLVARVKKQISVISSRVKLEPSLASPILASKFLLALISVLSPVDKATIEDCIANLSRLEKPKTEIVCTSALDSLFRQKAIYLVSGKYYLTPDGYLLLDKMLPRIARSRKNVVLEIDNLRIEYLNSTLRGKKQWSIEA